MAFAGDMKMLTASEANPTQRKKKEVFLAKPFILAPPYFIFATKDEKSKEKIKKREKDSGKRY